jgi:hypothetical protein
VIKAEYKDDENPLSQSGEKKSPGKGSSVAAEELKENNAGPPEDVQAASMTPDAIADFKSKRRRGRADTNTMSGANLSFEMAETITAVASESTHSEILIVTNFSTISDSNQSINHKSNPDTSPKSSNTSAPNVHSSRTRASTEAASTQKNDKDMQKTMLHDRAASKNATESSKPLKKKKFKSSCTTM